MSSRILVISDASIQALDQVVTTLEEIRCTQMRVRVLFISRLTGAFTKGTGPNILGLLMKEEQETLQRARNYLLRKEVPYNLKLISAPTWKGVFEEIDMGMDDLLILQGEFAAVWEKDHPSSYGPKYIPGSANPVWVLKGSEESYAVPVRP